MKLSETSNSLLQNIGQCLAPFILLCTALLSHFLGKQFYLLNLSPLILIVPITTALILAYLTYKKYDRDFYEALKKQTHAKPNQTKHSLYQDLVVIEKYLYLTIYTISDFICAYDLASLCFTIIQLNISAFVLNLTLFSTAATYCFFIYSNCRKDEMDWRYNIIQNAISEYNAPPADKYIQKLFTLFIIYTSIYLSLTYTTPYIIIPLSMTLIALATTLYNIKDFFQFHYALYLLVFAFQHCSHFSSLIRVFLGQLKIPFTANKAVDIIIPCIATLYTCTYTGSIVRTEQLRETLHNDTKPEKTNS